jgi:hypothetical protein
VSLLIDSGHGEIAIDIRPAQPLAGDARPEEMIRRELEHLRAAIDRILATPGAISRLDPNPTAP